MKVSNGWNNTYNKKINQNKLNFKGGKTYLITDFDGTLKTESMFNSYNLYKYFYSIRQFQNALSNKLKIIISTGRNKYWCKEAINEEMDYKKRDISPEIRKKYYPNVSSIIANNGEKKYKIIDNELTYSENYEIKKIKFLKKRFQIDLKKMGLIIKQTIEKNNLSNNVKYNKHFPLKLSFKFDKIDKTQYISIINQLYDELGLLDTSFDIYADKEENEVFVKLKRNCQSLAKDTDAIMKLEKAKQNNDLVIVAGNGVNDKEMLNIFSYVNLPQNYKIPSNYEEAQLLLTNHPEIKKQIDKLPLRIIVVGDLIQNSSRDSESLMDFFQSNFSEQYKFIPNTENYQSNYYLKAIKSSINSHLVKNPEFSKEYNFEEICTLIN